MNNMYDTPAGGHDSYPAGGNDCVEVIAAERDRRKRRLRWGAGVILAGFLAGGAITLAAVTGGGTAAASSASTQGAELNSALSTAASNSTAVTPARVRSALARLRRLGGIDGTLTYHNRTGFHTIAFERGTIESVSSSDIVVKAADGTTWSWQIVTDTVVREDGSKVTTSALAAGEKVFAGGPVVSGTKDARLIVIAKTKPTASSPAGSVPSSAGSTSSQTSLC